MQPMRVTVALALLWNSWITLQSSDEHLSPLEIGRLGFANNRCVRTTFVANQRSVFRVPSSLPCDYLDLANCLKVCFVYVLSHWLNMLHNLPLPTRLSYMLTSYGNAGSLIIPMTAWLEVIDTNYNCKPHGACYWCQKISRFDDWLCRCCMGEASVEMNFWWHGTLCIPRWVWIDFYCSLDSPSYRPRYFSCV